MTKMRDKHERKRFTVSNYPLFPLTLLPETMFHFVAHADLELVILLSVPCA